MDINFYNYIINIYESAFVSLRQMVYQSHGFLNELEGSTHLSVVDRKSVHGAKLSSLQMNKLCNAVSYLTNPNHIPPKKLESFDIEGLINEIVQEFERIASVYAPLTISYALRLKNTDLITLSKANFELVVLNILYCCIKTKPDSRPKNIKITLTVTETDEYVVFHIYDHNKQFNPKELIDFAPPSATVFDEADPYSILNLISLSLRVAEKSAKDMNGKLSIASLKSSNRYDIYLPKSVDVPDYKMCSPVRYIPNYEFYNEILADIKLEYILTRVIESFEGEFEGVRQL